MLFMALVILCLRRRNRKRAERWAGGRGEDAPAEQEGVGREPRYEGGGDGGGNTGVGASVPLAEDGGEGEKKGGAGAGAGASVGESFVDSFLGQWEDGG